MQASQRGHPLRRAGLGVGALLVTLVLLAPAVGLRPSSVRGAARQATATPSTGAVQTDPEPAVDMYEDYGGGGGTNHVTVVNHVDGRLRIKARIELSHAPGDRVAPDNAADATGSCQDCQTFAVALQIVLRTPNAALVAPVNQAVAQNLRCHHCLTVALAYQYVVSVDDPTAVPADVRDLVDALQRELQAIAHDPTATLPQVEAGLSDVINGFQALAADLYQTRDQAADDAPSEMTPTPTATPAPVSWAPIRSGPPTEADQPTVRCWAA